MGTGNDAPETRTCGKPASLLVPCLPSRHRFPPTQGRACPVRRSNGNPAPRPPARSFARSPSPPARYGGPLSATRGARTRRAALTTVGCPAGPSPDALSMRVFGPLSNQILPVLIGAALACAVAASPAHRAPGLRSLRRPDVPAVSGAAAIPPVTVPARPDASALDGFWTVTAYCPCHRCCGCWADGRTASGTRADHRLVAGPPELPFDTVLDVPGYGRARVEDRGGAIRGRRLDVLFPTHAEARAWGIRRLAIQTPGGGP